MASLSSKDSSLSSLFSAKISLQDKDTSTAIPQISDINELDHHLPHICQSIFDALSSRQLEATYQRCLKLDLEEAGLNVLEEVSVQLIYKGNNVGTRRADLIVKTNHDNENSIMELKAVASLSSQHLKQLEFYMEHFQINSGYLINFPHDSLFPDIDNDDIIFQQKILSGDVKPLMDTNLRGKHSMSKVQIVKVTRSFKTKAQEAASK